MLLSPSVVTLQSLVALSCRLDICWGPKIWVHCRRVSWAGSVDDRKIRLSSCTEVSGVENIGQCGRL